MSVLNLALILISLTVVSSKEYVPVLVWSTQKTADSYPIITALTRLGTNEFTDYFLKRVKVEKPLILLFMEENLSVEDFSWRDVNENGALPLLKNITKLANDVAFLPSVHNPYKGLRKLKNHGYLWKHYSDKGFESLKDNDNVIYEVKLKEPEFLEDRPKMLKEHDQQMSEIYKEALNHKSNIMVVYTGNHSSWIDAELGRFKREEKDENSSNTLIITDSENIVRMALTPPIIYKYDDTKVINITKTIGPATIQNTSTGPVLRVKFPLPDEKNVPVDFAFTSRDQDWWTLNNIEIQDPKKTLTPTIPVGAPSGHSFFCNPTVEFKGGNISMIFENFQVQPLRDHAKSFGPVLHCIPYFSIAIWSGLVIVFILSIVLAWGIVMIMDINTNDRFDDPKGKTITITATD